MADELTLRVITPYRIVLDTTVSVVRFPAVDGSMGVLKNHAPMVAALDAGVLTYVDDGREQAVFVSGGFVEVRDNTVRVVSEAGERPEEIDETRAREAEERARKRLDDAQKGAPAIDVLRAELALRRAILRLKARGQAALD